MTEKTNKSLADRISHLAVMAAATLAIYLIFVYGYPLLPNILPHENPFDLEMLMSDRRWFVFVYIGGLFGLYYLFWRSMRWLRRTAAENSNLLSGLKRFVLGGSLLYGIVLLFLYPVSAIDVLNYYVRGRFWALYDASPMLYSTNSFPNDPYMSLSGESQAYVSPYGPLWELVVQIPLRLGAIEPGAGVVAIKLMLLLSLLATAWLLGWKVFPKDEAGEKSSLLALTFYAWNPLVLMQGIGNGHNDILLMLLVTAGIVLCQRRRWLLAALALVLATLAKLPGLLLLPIFAVLLLREETTWRDRITKLAVIFVVSVVVILLVYAPLGPLSEVFFGIQRIVLQRRGFAPASAVRMILREIIPREVAEPIPRTVASVIFVIYYASLLLRVWQGRLGMVAAGFWTYFSLIVLGATFRIWYPLWLVPLAAIMLTSDSFWRAFLIGLTGELSIVSYFVLWRWELHDWAWGLEGPLGPYWNYWTIMTTFNVAWVFGIPLLVPPLLKRWKPETYQRSLLL
ncbi:glycosyltransferase 87 family protein [Chloroflexota bacterium]